MLDEEISPVICLISEFVIEFEIEFLGASGSGEFTGIKKHSQRRNTDITEGLGVSNMIRVESILVIT